jgi:hypothetical protein
MKPMIVRRELFQTALAETALRTGKLKHAPPNRVISLSLGNTMWFYKTVE